MQIVIDTELLVGLAAAIVLTGALVASPLFRNLGLAAAAAGLCAIYVKSGADGVAAAAATLAADLSTHRQFASGLGLGATLVVFAATAWRLRRPA
jgi:hypothetical protein